MVAPEAAERKDEATGKKTLQASGNVLVRWLEMPEPPAAGAESDVDRIKRLVATPFNGKLKGEMYLHLHKLPLPCADPFWKAERIEPERLECGPTPPDRCLCMRGLGTGIGRDLVLRLAFDSADAMTDFQHSVRDLLLTARDPGGWNHHFLQKTARGKVFAFPADAVETIIARAKQYGMNGDGGARDAPAPAVPELQLKPLPEGAINVLKEAALKDDALPGRRSGSKSVGGTSSAGNGGRSASVNSALAAVMGRERAQTQSAASNAASAGSSSGSSAFSRRSTFASFLDPSGTMNVFEIGRAVRAQMEGAQAGVGALDGSEGQESGDNAPSLVGYAAPPENAPQKAVVGTVAGQPVQQLQQPKDADSEEQAANAAERNEAAPHELVARSRATSLI